jgi:HD-GYP domain-containing protein (c-di-GMP phosphodiesterase class II)
VIQELGVRSRLLPAIQGAVAHYHRGTADHSARVARLARLTGERFGLEDDELEALSWAGILHDVGKLAVREEVLAKDGPLTEQEWVEVRRHPAVGSDLLLLMSARLAPIAASVRAHHERWDGTGYPDALAGDDIPLGGRILAVADVFDSITHRRPYRTEVFSEAEAVAFLDAGAGHHFDPAVVERFLALPPSERLPS